MTHSSGVRAVRRLAGVALVGAVSLAASGAAGAATTANRVSGNAFGLRANGTLVGNIIPIDIGPVPQVSLNQGSRANNNVPASFTDSLASLGVGTPPILGVGVLDVSTTGTVGPGGSSTSTATVANLSGLINADAVSSTCTADATGFHSSTTLTNLGFLPTLGLTNPGTVTLTTPGTPIFALLGVTVTLNEVVLDGANSTPPGPGPGAITPYRTHFSGHVNAVHIASNGLLGNFDIVIAHAHCDISNRIT